MFGDLTTVSLGYSQGTGQGSDSSRATRDASREEIERRNYRVGLTQVLTRNMLLSLNFETVTEQGYLQNPYRFMRYVNPLGRLHAARPEDFPGTRTSNAGSVRLKYYLPWRAALEGQYRFYTDTWGINAHTAGLEYTHPLRRPLDLLGLVPLLHAERRGLLQRPVPVCRRAELHGARQGNLAAEQPHDRRGRFLRVPGDLGVLAEERHGQPAASTT